MLLMCHFRNDTTIGEKSRLTVVKGWKDGRIDHKGTFRVMEMY